MSVVQFDKVPFSKYELHFTNENRVGTDNVEHKSDKTIITNIHNNSFTKLVFIIPFVNNEYFERVEITQVFRNDFGRRNVKHAVLTPISTTHYIYKTTKKYLFISEKKVQPITSPENNDDDQSATHIIDYVNGKLRLYQNDYKEFTGVTINNGDAAVVSTTYKARTLHNFENLQVLISITLQFIANVIIQNDELFITSATIYPQSVSTSTQRVL